MTDSNYVYDKGTLFVSRGGGSAPEPLPAGANGQGLVYDDSTDLGVDWGDTVYVPETSGSAATKGTFTFSSGTHAKILTTKAAADSVVVYTIKTLGTVTVAQAINTTLDAGVGFTPVSADATDTSVVNWQILS